MLLSGVDESGRGPVLGPLIISVASIEEERRGELSEMGVTDSKKLTASRREELFPEINKLCRCSSRIIAASELNRRMGRESLNLIEAKEMGALIKPLEGKIYLDLPERNVEHFLRKAGLAERGIVAEHKADLKYPIVGAASIIAKVTRDRMVHELEKRVGEKIGCGYTSDKDTIAALRNPETRKKLIGEIRERWSTMKRILQPKLTDF
ncbi:ribonuclease HII [Candidatus Micrarchaeota archaeon]|nr:ribonuclease HII [Candidatus Micrarchaeota archaeon]